MVIKHEKFFKANRGLILLIIIWYKHIYDFYNRTIKDSSKILIKNFLCLYN